MVEPALLHASALCIGETPRNIVNGPQPSLESQGGCDILPRDRSRYQDAKSQLLFTMQRWGLATQKPLGDQGSFPWPHTSSQNYPESKRRWCPQGLSGVDSPSKDPSTASASSDGCMCG